jgi:hypothetical protein
MKSQEIFNVVLEHLRKQTIGLTESAPQTQAALIAQTIKSMQYLQQHVPQDTRGPSILNKQYKCIPDWT